MSGGLWLNRLANPWSASGAANVYVSLPLRRLPMRVHSGHVKFDRSVTWKKMLPAFRPLFTKFLEESGQMPQDPEILAVLVEENLRDLRENRKPEGYNREGTMRLMFPISKSTEFYVYSRTKTTEVGRVVEALSRILQKYRLKHTVEWDKLLAFQDKK